MSNRKPLVIVGNGDYRRVIKPLPSINWLMLLSDTFIAVMFLAAIAIIVFHAAKVATDLFRLIF